jgi:hypothetical protein
MPFTASLGLPALPASAGLTFRQTLPDSVKKIMVYGLCFVGSNDYRLIVSVHFVLAPFAPLPDLF